MNEAVEKVLYLTKDPLSPIENGPAVTTLLFKVCQNDHERFDEAVRLVGLFVEEAMSNGNSV